MPRTPSRNALRRLWLALTHRSRGRYDDPNADDPYRVPTRNEPYSGSYDGLSGEHRAQYEAYRNFRR
jgi:hypothetical protein